MATRWSGCYTISCAETRTSDLTTCPFTWAENGACSWVYSISYSFRTTCSIRILSHMMQTVQDIRWIVFCQMSHVGILAVEILICNGKKERWHWFLIENGKKKFIQNLRVTIISLYLLSLSVWCNWLSLLQISGKGGQLVFGRLLLGKCLLFYL